MKTAKTNSKAIFSGFSNKTFWDWLELLIVPIVLVLSAFYLKIESKLGRKKLHQNGISKKYLVVTSTKCRTYC